MKYAGWRATTLNLPYHGPGSTCLDSQCIICRRYGESYVSETDTQVANPLTITVWLLPLVLGLFTYTPDPVSSDTCPPQPICQLLRFLPPPSEATPHSALQALPVGQTRTFGAEAIRWRLLVVCIKPTRLSSLSLRKPREEAIPAPDLYCLLPCLACFVWSLSCLGPACHAIPCHITVFSAPRRLWLESSNRRRMFQTVPHSRPCPGA